MDLPLIANHIIHALLLFLSFSSHLALPLVCALAEMRRIRCFVFTGRRKHKTAPDFNFCSWHPRIWLRTSVAQAQSSAIKK